MQKKIFMNFFIILLIGILTAGILSVGVIKKYYNGAIENKLISNTQLVNELISDKIDKYGKQELDMYLQRIKEITNSRITLIDIAGKVMSDTDKDASNMENHTDRYEIKQALQGKLGKSKRFSKTLEVDLLYIAQPIYIKDNLVGVIRLSTPLYEINTLLNKLYRSAFLAVLAGMLIASLLGYRMSIKITSPIKEINYVAAQITKGNYNNKILFSSKDEIGQLGESINYMASALDETINSLTDKNIRMEAILSSVVNGIIAVDSFKRILFINPVAINMLDIKDKDVAGRHFLQVIRNNQLDNFLKDILQQSNFTETELTVTYPIEKVLKVYTNPIKHLENNKTHGIIITLQDITELRKLERMRSEFVANVSHELKTPLTSIKGFVETLKNGAIEDKAVSLKFLNIIDDEADRLNRLISDILSLSELENKKVKNLVEAIDIKKVINELVSMLKNQADKKGIMLAVELDENLYAITGELDKFKQMIINLIDNAVKYTPEKGMVQIQAFNQENNVVINIIDNGIGIPKEHIPRLFERFYRVDKARSRKVGGTGLGLAIVKHIVKLFNGEINVDSKVGEGTKFNIVLPVQNEEILMKLQ